METIAVIGTGNISNRHRSNIKKIFPESQIIAMTASGRKPKSLPDNADIIVDGIDYILQAKPDWAIVASPATLHLKHALPLIQQGTPVLIEKPVTANYSDSSSLLSALAPGGPPVNIAYCLRYLPAIKIMKNLLRKHCIGNITEATISVGQHLPEWRPNMEYQKSVSAQKKLGGGALLELSHELDYTQWLLGQLYLKSSKIEQVSSLDIDVEDSADIILTNENSIDCHIHLDFIKTPASRYCELRGTKGTIKMDIIKNKVTLIKNKTQKIIYQDNNFNKNNMYIDMLIDFKRAMSLQANQLATPHEAHHIISLINQVKKGTPWEEGL